MRNIAITALLLPTIAISMEIILTDPFELEGNTLKTGDGRIYIIGESAKVDKGDIEHARKIKARLDHKGAIKEIEVIEFWEEETEEGGRKHEIEEE